MLYQIKSVVWCRLCARSESGEVTPRRQHGATVEIVCDAGHVVTQKLNQDGIELCLHSSNEITRASNYADDRTSCCPMSQITPYQVTSWLSGSQKASITVLTRVRLLFPFFKFETCLACSLIYIFKIQIYVITWRLSAQVKITLWKLRQLPVTQHLPHWKPIRCHAMPTLFI